LCAALGPLWFSAGYLVEGRRWSEQAIAQANGSASAELALCLALASALAGVQGDSAESLRLATRSVTMARDCDEPRVLIQALQSLGAAQHDLGDSHAAQQSWEEVLRLAEDSANVGSQGEMLGNLAILLMDEGHYERAEKLMLRSLGIFDNLGGTSRMVWIRLTLARLLTRIGRLDEAQETLHASIEQCLELRNPEWVVDLGEIYAFILVQTGDATTGARLLGATEAMRDRNGLPRLYGQDQIDATRVAGRGQLTTEQWEQEYQIGSGGNVEKYLRQLLQQ
jgi:tetratricopeptide (TPR) repeat protein